jgi:chromosome segregation ATPase
MPNALSTKKKMLQAQLDALIVDYESVYQQLSHTRDKADRNQLQRKADDLFEQMERVEAELNQCQSSKTTYNDYYKNWEKHWTLDKKTTFA